MRNSLNFQCLIVVVFFLAGCSTIMPQSKPYQPIAYTGGKAMWPAVLATTTKWSKDCARSEINILKDVYEFYDCKAQGSDRIRFDTSIKKVDGKIMVDTKPEHFVKEKGKWVDGMPLLASADLEGSKTKTAQDIKSILDDDAEYNKHKRLFINDFYFHVYVMESMTSVAKQDWIATLAKDKSTFDLQMSMGDMKLLEKPEHGAKYAAYLLMPSSTRYGLGWYTSKIRLLTNDKTVAYNKKGDLVKTKGRFVSYLAATKTFTIVGVE